MPEALVLDLERAPLDRPRPAFSRLPAAARQDHKETAAAPIAGPGGLTLIERCASESDLTSAERETLSGANIIVYERSLARFVAAALPLGFYAEPAPEAGQSPDKPVFERCLKFALDGWSVVQLMERRTPAERARWIEDAAAQLVTAGVSSDTLVRVLADPACGGALTIETQLRSARAAIGDRLLPDGVVMVLGPIAGGPAPQVYAFAANGLAG